MIKDSLKSFLDRMGYIVLKKGTPADLRTEREFLNLFEASKPFTMVSTDRSFALYKAAQYVVRNHIPGDFVECGVWRGGQAMLAARTFQKEGDTSRKFWLYDTYTGMSEPTSDDVYLPKAEDPAPIKWQKLNKGTHTDWCYASLDDVKTNLASVEYPQDKILFIEGKVEDTIPANIPEHIALLRLDTDFYESTRHELEHLYPRLVKGGVLILDDYGSWAGARKAVDEYFAAHGIQMLLTRVDQGRIGVKVD